MEKSVSKENKPIRSSFALAFMGRYKDAYWESDLTVGIGYIIKLLGIVIGIVIIILVILFTIFLFAIVFTVIDYDTLISSLDKYKESTNISINDPNMIGTLNIIGVLLSIIFFALLIIIFGICVGVILFIQGRLVTSQGQTLRASLDSSVQSSPFLTNEQKAEMMSLHKDQKDEEAD